MSLPPQRPSHWGWLRTLRWRLALTYAALLAGLLLVLGVFVALVLGQVLYTAEFDSFRTDARALAALNQGSFDRLVRGDARSATLYGCSTALPATEAFRDAIAAPLLAAHEGIRAIYLLDRTGTALVRVPDALPPGDRGPYLSGTLPTDVTMLLRQAQNAPRGGGTGVLRQASFRTVDAQGEPVGITLMAVRYHESSYCVAPQNTTVGIVEVVTDFPRVRLIRQRIQLALLLAGAAALVVGIGVGGLLLGQTLRPLTRMAQAAGRVAAGDLSQRVRLPHSGDEIGHLAAAFDGMVDRIESAFAAQRASEQRMRQFIADASHELRTPLTAIRGFVDVLLRGARNDPATAEQVLIATRREAERMSRLVSDLLTLARLDAGPPMDLRPLDLIALAGEAVDQARILAGAREVSIQTDGRGRLLVLADADHLKQVLLILLDNALKYGKPAPEGWVRVTIERAPGLARLRVADNGAGIAATDLPYIFDRFYRAERAERDRRLSNPNLAPEPATTPPAGPSASGISAASASATGTGLGLAIARALVEAMRGTIAVESVPGMGTTFTVTLPTAQAPQTASVTVVSTP